MNWDLAHGIAKIAAVHAHRDLAIRRDTYIDVFAALRKAGVDGMSRPLPRLFGYYIAPEDDGPCVLLNAQLDEITLRHTAAHEIGHHSLKHGSAFDEDLDRSSRWGDGSWPDEEKTAEAFAAWFLMPPPAVVASLALVGVDRPTQPDHAYQAARWLGTSYAGTVRQMARLRLISPSAAAPWVRVPPAKIKTRLLAGAPISASGHAHAVGAHAHGAALRVAVGDCICVRIPGAVLGPLPPGLSPGGPRGMADDQETFCIPGEPPIGAVAYVTEDFTEPAGLAALVPGSAGEFHLTLVPTPRRLGDDRVWGSC